MNTLLLVLRARKRDNAAFKHAFASSILIPLSLAVLLFLVLNASGAILAGVWTLFAPLVIIGSILGVGHVLYFRSIMKRLHN
jgi:heme/copper-type cytochrome/quinol oxidase subunit 1